MASGIGNKTELASNKINCVADVPGVGKNLQVRHGVSSCGVFTKRNNVSLLGNNCSVSIISCA